ncbi:MAG: XisI protein [Bacteroidia bacterium]
MENVEKYRNIIINFMQEQAKIRSNRTNVETQFIKDDAGGHYQLVNLGFNKGRRIYGCFLHIDLKPDGKVWIQHDGTDLGVAAILNDLGISKADIVLGFYQPKYRSYTGFSAA